MGATKALVIDVLPAPPGSIARAFVGAARKLSPFHAVVPAGMEVIRLAPPKLLGAPLEAIYWTRANAEAWIRGRRGTGRRDKTFHCELFCERIDADMPAYQIHRLKEAPRQQFRWAPHTPGVTIVKLKDYEPGDVVEAASPYALWLALRETDQALAVGDLIEDARRANSAF